ncbi:MAG: AAA family ATPase [Ktedonobacterales bacterium]
MADEQASRDTVDLTGSIGIVISGDNRTPISPLHEVQSILEERLAGLGDGETAGAENERSAAELLGDCLRAAMEGGGRPMILLRHLHVHALKQLREVEFWFPRRGSILIEGQNEAGKSTVLEAIYFGLYGEAMIGERARATLEGLLPHDGSAVYVELTLAIGEVTLEVSRQLLPKSTAPGVTHEAQLRIRRAQMPLEEINGTEAVNSRILQEMKGVDGDTLRNSCFIEQKGLDRVEWLARSQRDASIAKLVGIPRLHRIEQELRSAADEAKRQMEQLRREYEIASLRQAATDAEFLATTAEEQMHAAQVRLLLEERDSRDVARELQQQQIAALNATRYGLSARMASAARLQALQIEVDNAAQQFKESSEAQAFRNETVALLEKLERLEKEALPILTQRLNTLEVLEGELSTIEALRAEAHDASFLEQRVAEELRRHEDFVTEKCRELAVSPEHELVAIERGRAEAERRDLDEQLQARETLLLQLQQRTMYAEETMTAADHALARLQERLLLEGIDAGEHIVREADLIEWQIFHEQVERTLQQHRVEINEQQALAELATIEEQLQTLQQGEEAAAALSARLGEQIVELLARHIPASHVYYGSEPLDKLASDWPLLANVDDARFDSYDEMYRTASHEAQQLRQSADTYAKRYGLEATELEVETCSQRLTEGERHRRRYEFAAEMAEQLCERVQQHILPEMEGYVRRLLPELTAGRYRDVELLAEDQSDPSSGINIRLWDEAAGRYVAQNVLSGGTRDQCALALRLAFALVMAPKEFGTIPSFIFLDEPLSSFDAQRSQALVRILAEGAISEQFDQVVLVSHSQTFRRDGFRFYIRLENGRVSESNLPLMPSAEQLWLSKDPLKPEV